MKTAVANPPRVVNGAEAVILSLLHERVDTIFGYPGGAIMPVYDALYGYQKEIQHILVRHEQGAVHAAQGYARACQKAGVCLATSGPGATNLLTGIADAMIDSTPLVCITGQVYSHLLGSDAFQETDVVGISMPVTKWNYQVTRAEEIPEAIAKAFFIATSGRPGPVLLDITKDAQFGTFAFDYKPCQAVRSYHPDPKPASKSLKAAAELLNASEKPLVLMGQGVLLSGAEEALTAVLEKANLPVAATLLGLSGISVNHPNYVGYLGMHGNYGPNIKTNECDVLFAVGMRFDDRVTGNLKKYAPDAQVIHIDIDASELGKNVPLAVGIHSDAKIALEGLLPHLEKRDRSAWIEEFRACEREEDQAVKQEAIAPKEGPLLMAEVIHQLSLKSKGRALIVTDVGQHQMMASRYYRFEETRSLITSGGLGTMGFALPAAMGAKLAEPKREVIAIIGDGGFQMTIQELGTLFQYGIPVKILVLNNQFLGMVRQWQELFFDRRYSFTEMCNPDFQQVVRGFGIRAEKVEDRDALGGALDEFLAAEESFFLEVVVAKEENVFPMVPSGASVAEIRLK